MTMPAQRVGASQTCDCSDNSLPHRSPTDARQRGTVNAMVNLRPKALVLAERIPTDCGASIKFDDETRFRRPVRSFAAGSKPLCRFLGKHALLLTNLPNWNLPPIAWIKPA